MEDLEMEVVSGVETLALILRPLSSFHSHAFHLLRPHAQDDQGPTPDEKDIVRELVNEVQRIRRNSGVGSPEVRSEDLQLEM